MKVTRKSLLTGKQNTLELDITPQEMEWFEQGEAKIQELWPHLTPEQHDFIKTGILEQEINERIKQ